MQFPVPINKALPRPPRILGVTMWVLFVFLLAGIYGPWLLQPFVSPWGLVVDHMELRILLSLLYQPPSGAIYSSQTWFLGIWVVGLSACALLWRVSPRRRIARAISCFPLGILVIAPFAVPLKYGSYNTLESFEAPQGYEVNWLTQPEEFLGRRSPTGTTPPDNGGLRGRFLRTQAAWLEPRQSTLLFHS